MLLMEILIFCQLHILQLHKLPFTTAHFNFTTAQIVINCTLKYALPFAIAPLPCRAGPLPWLALWYGVVSLPLAIRSLPRVFSQKFDQQLKTTLFGRAGVGSASE